MPIREYPGWRIETLSDVLGASCSVLSSAMSSSTLAMPLIPVETLNISLGALLLAVVLSAMYVSYARNQSFNRSDYIRIYGITCVQTFELQIATARFISYFHIQLQLLPDIFKRPSLCKDTGEYVIGL